MTDPITERIRRKYADLEQDGLFDEPEHVRSEEPQKKVAKPKVVDRQKCPICNQEKIRVIRVVGEQFRPRYTLDTHFRVTIGGHKFPCAGTGMEAQI